MNTKQIIDDIALKTKLKKKQVDEVIHFYHCAIIDELVAGGEYSMATIGRLIVKESKAREGRNPKTGEKIQIKAKRTVSFHSYKYLKDNIQKGE